MYCVYILKCNDGSLYTGITTDMEKRFREHANGKGGAYTRSHGAQKIVYTENRRNRSAAQKREAEIKRLARRRKLALIASRL